MGMGCRDERRSGSWLEQRVKRGAFTMQKALGGTGLGEKSGVKRKMPGSYWRDLGNGWV